MAQISDHLLLTHWKSIARCRSEDASYSLHSCLIDCCRVDGSSVSLRLESCVNCGDQDSWVRLRGWGNGLNFSSISSVAAAIDCCSSQGSEGHSQQSEDQQQTRTHLWPSNKRCYRDIYKDYRYYFSGYRSLLQVNWAHQLTVNFLSFLMLRQTQHHSLFPFKAWQFK